MVERDGMECTAPAPAAEPTEKPPTSPAAGIYPATPQARGNFQGL